MKIRVAILLPLLLCGCECFLPGGKPPEGNIVENLPQGIAETVMDYRSAVDFYINELIRETMMHCAGEAVYVDADRATRQAADFIIRKSGELSGIRSGTAKAQHVRLVSRYVNGKSWQMTLFAADGKQLWQRSVIIKQ